MAIHDNLNSNYIPNNIAPTPAKEYISINDSLPKKLCDIKNRFIGYTWNYGDKFDLNLSLNNIIPVREDSIIYTKQEEKPCTNTLGYKGLQAYNTVDNKSWTCVGLIDGVYIWIEDDEVTYALDGSKLIEMVKDMTGKTMRVDFYNFRWELIYSYEANDTSTISYHIDDDFYKAMGSGIYYTTIRAIDEESSKLMKKFILEIN